MKYKSLKWVHAARPLALRSGFSNVRLRRVAFARCAKARLGGHLWRDTPLYTEDADAPGRRFWAALLPALAEARAALLGAGDALPDPAKKPELNILEGVFTLCILPCHGRGMLDSKRVHWLQGRRRFKSSTLGGWFCCSASSEASRVRLEGRAARPVRPAGS